MRPECSRYLSCLNGGQLTKQEVNLDWMCSRRHWSKHKDTESQVRDRFRSTFTRRLFVESIYEDVFLDGRRCPRLPCLLRVRPPPPSLCGRRPLSCPRQPGSVEGSGGTEEAWCCLMAVRTGLPLGYRCDASFCRGSPWRGRWQHVHPPTPPRSLSTPPSVQLAPCLIRHRGEARCPLHAFYIQLLCVCG